jgi:transcriptional regulator with XRE-family HTH domain
LLAVARRARGLSQAELADRLGVTNANISRIERGSDLKVSTLVDVARELKFEPLLVPKEHLSSVRALLGSLQHDDTAQPERPRFG